MQIVFIFGIYVSNKIYENDPISKAFLSMNVWHGS
jgi:hypothetical protein